METTYEIALLALGVWVSVVIIFLPFVILSVGKEVTRLYKEMRGMTRQLDSLVKSCDLTQRILAAVHDVEIR